MAANLSLERRPSRPNTRGQTLVQARRWPTDKSTAFGQRLTPQPSFQPAQTPTSSTLELRLRRPTLSSGKSRASGSALAPLHSRSSPSSTRFRSLLSSPLSSPNAKRQTPSSPPAHKHLHLQTPLELGQLFSPFLLFHPELRRAVSPLGWPICARRAWRFQLVVCCPPFAHGWAGWPNSAAKRPI